MYKGLFFLYVVCFSLYVLYSREPDYFDGETLAASIHWRMDSTIQKKAPKAVFEVNKKEYAVDASYIFRKLPENKSVMVIYHPRHPELAKVYSLWGYWITWGELLASVVLYIALFQVAVALTSNPTEESLLEQLEYKAEKKRRYDD